MNHKELILNYFDSTQINIKKPSPIFLPDLTTWYEFHHLNNSLPSEINGQDLEEVCRSLNVPIWNTCKPWRVENSSVEVSKIINPEEIISTYNYQNKVLSAKWIKGPDGDWWQTEYPVKNAEDLQIIKAYLKGRSFHLELDEIIQLDNKIKDDGIVIPRLPTRAFSWLMLEILGWTDGLMILLDEEEMIKELVDICELQIMEFCTPLIKSLHDKGFQIVLSPDNLDGMFISPEHFDNYLKTGYENISKICRENHSSLMVHGGGPLARIIHQISQSGINSIMGISGPPQGNTPIETLRTTIGNEIVLLGGIPQDYLMDSVDNEHFVAKIKAIIEKYTIDNNAILGIADHVPIEADISRLKQIADMIYKKLISCYGKGVHFDRRLGYSYTISLYGLMNL